jgi:hypothetical protein
MHESGYFGRCRIYQINIHWWRLVSKLDELVVIMIQQRNTGHDEVMQRLEWILRDAA